jgi:hypothetical protein
MNSRVKSLIAVLRNILRFNSPGDADALMRRTVEAVYWRDADIAIQNGGVYVLLVDNYKRVQKPEWKALRRRFGDHFGDDHRDAAMMLYGPEFESHTAEFRIGVVRDGVFSVK